MHNSFLGGLLTSNCPLWRPPKALDLEKTKSPNFYAIEIGPRPRGAPSQGSASNSKPIRDRSRNFEGPAKFFHFSACSSFWNCLDTPSPHRRRPRRAVAMLVKSLSDSRTAQTSLGHTATLLEDALFDIDDDEGICGRFGRFDDER